MVDPFDRFPLSAKIPPNESKLSLYATALSDQDMFVYCRVRRSESVQRYNYDSCVSTCLFTDGKSIDQQTFRATTFFVTSPEGILNNQYEVDRPVMGTRLSWSNIYVKDPICIMYHGRMPRVITVLRCLDLLR